MLTSAGADRTRAGRPWTAVVAVYLAVAAALYGVGMLLPYVVNDLHRLPLAEVASGAHDPKELWPHGAWQAPVAVAGLLGLAALPLTARALDGRLLACHGTPTSAWDMLLWHWEDEPRRGPGAGYYRARDPRELRAIVEPLNAEVVVCGHTHRPGATRVVDTLVVNSGSVSDQVDGDPRARWTLLEKRGGRWTARRDCMAS